MVRRIAYIDILNVILCFCVVCMHAFMFIILYR